MTGSVCAVADCKNSTQLKKTRPELVHHKIPFKEKQVSDKWVHACRRKDKFNPQKSFVCSDHFPPDAYQRDIKHELLGLPIRKILKPDAFPTIFEGRCSSSGILSKSAASRRERIALREDKENRKRIISDILENDQIKRQKTEDCIRVQLHKDQTIQTDEVDISPINTIQSYQRIRDQQDQQIGKKNRIISWLQTKLLKAENQLKVAIEKIKGLSKLNARTKQFLSKPQQQLLAGKRHVNWTSSDILKALSVCSVSIKAYETARVNWGLPLPCTRTLRRWIQNFGCKPGLLTEVFSIMKGEADSLLERNRACVLSFDEMSINSKVVIDKSDCSIVSATKVQVVMARGLFDGWKQPIYYNFDQSMSSELLFTIIRELEEAGYPVHAIICDLGGENRALLNSLKIDIGTSSFPNPYDKSRQVHVLADVPHMIKLLRNHLLDDGVVLQDSTYITKETFKDLIKSDDTELKFCPKLHSKLVDVTGAERMRVRYAAQLLSHHTATLAKKNMDSLSVSDFIQTINDGFDVLNSRVPKDDKNPLKSGLGINWNQQVAALQKLRDTLFTCCFLTKAGNFKKTLLPFQKGWIMSIDSVLKLINDMKIKYGISYILTSRLNQDCLESLFSCIRAFGGPNTCPTVPEFKYRLRLLLIGSHVRPPQNSNTDEIFKNCSWVSAKLIQRNNFNSRPSSFPSVTEGNINSSPFTETHQLYYLAGFVAFQLRKNGMLYGIPTAKCNGSSWIHMLSRGGLIVPSDNLFDWIKKCNDIFENNLHEIRGVNVKDALVEMITSLCPDIDLPVIKQFVSVRLKIRATYLSRQAGCKADQNRKKRLQFAKSNK